VTEAKLPAGCCDDCGGSRFLLGPRGGFARNIECTGCGSRFNVTVRFGELLFVQRVDGVGCWPDATLGGLADAEVPATARPWAKP
jgi:hypothetical protein